MAPNPRPVAGPEDTVELLVTNTVLQRPSMYTMECGRAAVIYTGENETGQLPGNISMYSTNLIAVAQGTCYIIL